jgi:MoaD family protein
VTNSDEVEWNGGAAGVYPAPPVQVPMARTATSITIRVPTPLRDSCGGAAELPASGPNVRAVLEDLERRFPALHRSVCDETGAVRRHVNVFVNTLNIKNRDGLDTALSPGDVVTILPAVSGGRACPRASSSASVPRRASSWPKRRNPGSASRCADRSVPAWRSTRR